MLPPLPSAIAHSAPIEPSNSQPKSSARVTPPSSPTVQSCRVFEEASTGAPLASKYPAPSTQVDSFPKEPCLYLLIAKNIMRLAIVID